LVNNFLGEIFNAQTAGHFAAKVPPHAIRDCHKQSAIFNSNESPPEILRNTTAIQGENKMIVLIVAPSASHVGDVSDARACTEDTLVFAAKGRNFLALIRHEEDPPFSCCV
jgi:hypothetical protein